MIITIDTGGTKTLIADFDKSGKIGNQIKFPTPKRPKDFIKLLRKTLIDNYKDKSVEIIVIGMPGIVKDGIVTWCNNLKWKNFDAVSALKGVLDKVPILLENDANLAGLSETRELKTIPPFALYVTISTGIGSGVITNGKINPELSRSEVGRSIVEYKGKAIEWEKFGSGKAFYKKYGKYARDITSIKTWNEIADRISRGFLAIIPAFQPNIIIIGGSIGTYYKKYDKMLHKILKKKLPPHIELPKIIGAKHSEQAVIYGCYYYAIDYLTNNKD